jgi:hypothetical protein
VRGAGSRTRNCLLLALVGSLLAGCNGAPVPIAPEPKGAPLGGHPPVVMAPSLAPASSGAVEDGLGPEILLPDPAAVDAEVARVGELSLRQSHAFARLTSAHPNLALTAIDLLVFDVLVARHAEQHGIRIEAAAIEAVAAEEEQGMRAQVAAELGAEVDFGAYVWRMFGMPLADWQRTLRVRTAQRLYQGYVIRYLALREDRAQVRFLVTKDRAVADEVVEKVRAGADFGTLALRWSEDPSRRDGGLLPPFGRGFGHPVAKAAFELDRGQVSAPFEAKLGDELRWFVVYCLDRLPGRDVPFAAVREEIDAELRRHPISPLETAAYTLRWRAESERSSGESGAADK